MEYTNPFECYEAIGKWLSNAVPEPWDRIEVYFEIIEMDDVWEDCIVYFPKKSPLIEKQFFIDDFDFTDCFYQLARLTSEEGKGFFKRCDFVLNNDGRYKVDFQY